MKNIPITKLLDAMELTNNEKIEMAKMLIFSVYLQSENLDIKECYEKLKKLSECNIR